MINQLVPNGHRVVAVHVWEYLAADRRARAIRLMAQLPFRACGIHKIRTIGIAEDIQAIPSINS